MRNFEIEAHVEARLRLPADRNRAHKAFYARPTVPDPSKIQVWQGFSGENISSFICEEIGRMRGEYITRANDPATPPVYLDLLKEDIFLLRDAKGAQDPTGKEIAREFFLRKLSDARYALREDIEGAILGQIREEDELNVIIVKTATAALRDL